MNILQLPDELLICILEYCPFDVILKCSCVCRTWNKICNDNLLLNRALLFHSPDKFVIKDFYCRSSFCSKTACRSSFIQDVKNKVKYSDAWSRKCESESSFITFRKRSIPWLVRDHEKMFVSDNYSITQFHYPQNDKRLRTPQSVYDCGNRGDVCRFSLDNHGTLAIGHDSGMVCLLSKKRQEICWEAHSDHIEAIDSLDNIIVTGSRDQTLKIWAPDKSLLWMEELEDRVWSVEISPEKRSLAVGCAASHIEKPSLLLYDLETNKLVNSWCLEQAGAGVKDVFWDSENTILSGSYDTAIRLYDIRIHNQFNRAALSWNDPHDCTIFCVRSDGDRTILAGLNQHGAVRFYDKRNIAGPVRSFYPGHCHKKTDDCRTQRCPAYCLLFDSTQLFIALEKKVSRICFDS